ncbi:MAG TPA: hypothetical protein VGY57_02740, partial [Vicinamibacterales bacterium]|nr:hypothetical protein [Vicinamibacterales bacterium]
SITYTAPVPAPTGPATITGTYSGDNAHGASSGVASLTFGLAQIPGTMTQITTSPASDQFDPHISGNIVCYTDLRNGSPQIYYFDLSTSTETRVTNNNFPRGGDQSCDVSGSIIVWADNLQPLNVQGLTIGTAGPFNIDAQNTIQVSPSVGGSLVAWMDDRNSTQGNSIWDIYAKDLTTGVEKRLTTNTLGPFSVNPNVSGRLVAYATQSTSSIQSTSCQVFVTNFDMLVTTQLTNTTGCNTSTDISGNRVVYQADRDGNQDIYVFDLTTNTETRISLPGLQRGPHISGDWVSFEDVSSGTSAILLYHVPTAALFIAVSSPTSNAFLNDIDGFRVVFTGDATGTHQIYVLEFKSPF